MLFLSHKVALLRIKDKDFLPIKQKLIEEEADNPSNVKDFIQKVQKALPPGTDEPPTLQSLLKKPDELIKEENAERFTIEELKSKQARTLENLKKITKEKHQNVQTEIDDLKKDLETRQKSLEKYVEVQGNIEEAIKFKEKKKPKKKTAQQTIKKASKTTAKEKKKVTGFQEWTKKENTVNICTGCANDCKYCYAKSMAYRFKRVPEGEWINQIIRDSDVNKKRKLYDGRVGFPTSHDITPDNLDAYLTVLKKLLESGNEVLIVSKPNLECIKKICEIGSNYKDKILFRFTIGAMNNDILRFWDTNAPLYEERKKSLKYAFDNGFQTSVSMEPLLDSANVITMATELEPYVTDAIWIGKMNHTGRLKTRAKNQDDQGLVEQVETIENGQTDDKIKAIFADFQKKPELLKKIKWKDSFKKILGIEEAAEAGMDV
jgi:DNA repair photolyase